MWEHVANIEEKVEDQLSAMFDLTVVDVIVLMVT